MQWHWPRLGPRILHHARWCTHSSFEQIGQSRKLLEREQQLARISMQIVASIWFVFTFCGTKQEKEFSGDLHVPLSLFLLRIQKHNYLHQGNSDKWTDKTTEFQGKMDPIQLTNSDKNWRSRIVWLTNGLIRSMRFAYMRLPSVLISNPKFNYYSYFELKIDSIGSKINKFEFVRMFFESFQHKSSNQNFQMSLETLKVSARKCR